jgi:hypothetical protein
MGGRLADDLAVAGLWGWPANWNSCFFGRFAHLPNRRLAKHVLEHARNWFRFLINPTIDAPN